METPVPDNPLPESTADSTILQKHESSPSVTRKRTGTKFHRKRRDGPTPTMELPDRLKDVGDADEDVVPPHAGANPMFMNVNQSIFGLIAAAGSKVDFNDRFEGQSSEDENEVEEEGDDDGGIDPIRGHKQGKGKAKERNDLSPMAKTVVLKKSGSDAKKKHIRRFSGNLLRSLPQLPRIHTKYKSKSTKLQTHTQPQPQPQTQTQTQTSDLSTLSMQSEMEREAGDKNGPNEITSSSIEVTESLDRESRQAPILSRMLEAKAQMSSRPSFDIERLSGDHRRDSETGDLDMGPTVLAQKLKEIFCLDKAEEVIEEYSCWLLQSVLLQGYMYITTGHVCFYAYLPKKTHEITKSGYLSKSGKRSPKYQRFWFILKGDVLNYYGDASNLYFPNGQIDLRYAISASVIEKEKDNMHFTIVTDSRTYHFRADSAPSAKEWVKSLQRVIFRSRNEGDSVKISLPIANILDIEDSPMVEFADTCKLRVIDNDETYAIDEYFFTFFKNGKQAINVLNILTDDASSQQEQDQDLEQEQTTSARLDVRRGDSDRKSHEFSPVRDSSQGSRTPGELRSPKVRDHVKATLSPMSPTSPRDSIARASGDFSRSSMDTFRPFGRKSVDFDGLGREKSPRRSFSGNRSRSKTRPNHRRLPPEKQGSSDSYVHSMDDSSASQILRGSEVFSPTIRRRSTSSDREHKASRDRPSALQAYHAKHAATTGHVPDPGAGESADVAQPSTAPAIQNLTKMGTYPFQRAGMFAGYLNQTSRRMGNLLATESMGYVEKVSGMWKGGHKHYQEPVGLKPDDDIVADNEDSEDKLQITMERFRTHFALPESEKLVATYFGYIVRVLPLYGKIYISNRHFCFRSLLPGTKTKLILPIKDIETVEKEKGFRFGYSGLVVTIRGFEELFFEFGEATARDDCAVTTLQSIEKTHLSDSEVIGKEEKEQALEAIEERDALLQARQEDTPDISLPNRASTLSDSSPTIVFDDPKASFLNFKPPPMRITCLTIGSRGDVQPYIALCKGLMAEGHKVKIATHAEFKSWIESHGIEFAVVDGDPSELMNICIQNGTFTIAFLREASSKFRGWLDDLLASSWKACQDSDLLIESPSAMAGIHIAEALCIPFFRAFTMPWTRTRAYPHAFITPEHKMGGAYNWITYVMFDNVFWKSTAGQINRWRKNTLKLPPTNLEKMQPNKVPFLYNFSPAVVPPPLDYSDWIRVTGYWFLDEGTDFMPPPDLDAFIKKARADGKKLVYVGFGSILVPDTAKMTREVIDAVLRADVRCILSKGWSDRITSKPGDADAIQANKEPELPPEIFQIRSAPHDWLFRQVDAAAHHGGSGTTGASLRAGIPTIIRPFFGDQFFFGARVEDLGVGLCLKKWGAASFARALWEACHNTRMIKKAESLGESIRRDNGINAAIQCIYRDLDYARSLVETKVGRNRDREEAAHMSEDAEGEPEEESWTFVGASGSEEGDGSAVGSVYRSPVLTASSITSTGTALGSRLLSGGSTRHKALQQSGSSAMAVG